MNKDKIINKLLQNTCQINNLGLMNGKMGIAIFFFHLARETEITLYEDYAGQLIDEIYEELSSNTTISFSNGLAGVGWGIEHLVQNEFIQADTDEVLEDFDKQLFQSLMFDTPKHLALSDGLLGLGTYFLWRIKNPEANDENIKTLTNKKALIYLVDELDRMFSNDDERMHNLLKSGDDSFEITWDYTALIWFLTELYLQDVINFKIDKLLQQLLRPLSNKDDWPKLNSNRLLLVVVIQRILNHMDEKWITSFYKSTELDLQALVVGLEEGVSQEVITAEISESSFSLLYGSAGIAWLCFMIQKVNEDEDYSGSVDFWLKRSFKFISSDAMNYDRRNGSFGLIEGIAGAGLLDCFVNENVTTDVKLI